MASITPEQYNKLIKRIRTDAVYGSDVRDAIADAIAGSTELVDDHINTAKSFINGLADACDTRMDNIQTIVMNRVLYIELADLGNNKYRLNIINNT